MFSRAQIIPKYLVFESVSAQTPNISRQLKVPANLFLDMLKKIEEKGIDSIDKEFAQKMREYVQTVTNSTENIFFDKLEDISKLYFELLNLIYILSGDKKNLEKNRPMAICLMDLYPFIHEIVKNHEMLLMYSEEMRLEDVVW